MQRSNETSANLNEQAISKSQLGQTLRLEGGGLPAESLATMRAFLSVIRSRADLGMHLFVDGPILLGRDPDCHVPLHDFGVSRRHAMISPEGSGHYILQDLGSTNGTRVNGKPIPGPHSLRDGEKIAIGDTVLRFALADAMDIDFHNEVATLVSTDPLTGLPAKRRFDQAFDFSLQAAKQANRSLALLMMDMDGVKQINDTHGHLFGAYVIGETGRLIARMLGTAGQACRFGGDEFSAFLPGHDLAAAMAVGERIRAALEQAGLEKEGIPLRPTMSIGVAIFPDAGDQLLHLVTNADQALYEAKHLGKNRVVSYSA